MRHALGAAILALACLALAACGHKTELIRVQVPVPGIVAKTPQAGQKLGFPAVATKNTTRVAGGDPVADAAGVALSVYPSALPSARPHAVVLAPTDDWEAALAASVLMAPPVRAPMLLSGSGSLPAASSDALKTLSPSGSSALGGVQLVRVGSTPTVKGLHSTALTGRDPFSLVAAIDRYMSAAAGRPSGSVVVASADAPAYAMPAAGWAAESGDPLLFVVGSSIPSATRQALVAHGHPNIYVLGPPSVIGGGLLSQLARLGTVKRIAVTTQSGTDPVSSSIAFAEYRDPVCVQNKPCVHVPGSFGWALRSPGHGYTLLNSHRTLDAAASAALSASGDYGPQLVLDDPSKLPSTIQSYFLDFATPGYTQEGPTAAVYNHGWVIGDQNAVSVLAQAQMDSLLEVKAVPQQ